ncbi:SDR family oxidoreductase [Caulobacter sp. KR2-114]|uniref:SDR family oxidoreductase n=1 Tax=Caulobacter sp. KR2-114 TaxID=3400912 RepID=UPI003C112D80
MRIFVTGATGFIGAAVVDDLLTAGHEVIGLARSAAAAGKLKARGVKVHRGAIEDMDGLRRATAEADGAVHAAFFHAFSQASLGARLRVLVGGAPSGIVERFMTAAVEVDRRAIEALGGGLRGGGRPLVVAFPTMAMAPGRLALEDDLADPAAVGGLRARSERAAVVLADRGVRATIVRLPPSVHDEARQGLVTRLIEVARKTRRSGYVGNGENRWSAVHRCDAARLFRLALETGEAGARYHAVAEHGIAMRDIAEVIAEQLGVQAESLSRREAAQRFSWLAPFVGADNPVSSLATQQRLNWVPVRPPLMVDISAALHATSAGAPATAT